MKLNNLLFLLTLLLLTPFLGMAQSPPQLQLGGHTWDLPANHDAWRSLQTTAKSQSFLAHTYLIAGFETLPTPDEQRALEKNGLTLLSYYQHGAFFVSLDPTANLEALHNHGLVHLSAVPRTTKLAPSLTGGAIPDHCLDGAGNITLDLVFAEDLSEAELSMLQNSIDGEVIKFKPYFHSMTVKMDLNEVPSLMDLPGLETALPTEVTPTPDGARAVHQHRSNGFLANVPGMSNYLGNGVAIAIGDNSKVLNHIDWQGRVDNHMIVNPGEHSEMVAGVAAGAGNLDPLAIGHAPHADLEIYKSYTDTDLMPGPYNNLGVRVTIHSLSGICNGLYNSGTRETDQTMRDLPELLHVFSAGNEGKKDCGFGAGDHWGTITGGRKIAKSCITVGAVDDQDMLASFSSRGPTSDFRLKPDCVAGGVGIKTTKENDLYGGPNGTSVSAPAVGGILATMVQAFRVHNPTLPAYNDVMKAALLNSAQDLGTYGPDYKFGYGRVNAAKAIAVIEEGRWVHDTLNGNGPYLGQIQVPAGVAEVKVMLVWMDRQKPASSTGIALQNDLDLKMGNPANPTLPWILEQSVATNAALKAPAVQGEDHLNTVEQITMQNPPAGAVTYQVSASAMVTNEQRFAVTYEFVYDTVNLTHPMGGESWVPGEVVRMHWDAANAGANYAIEYSPNGNNWTTLAGNVDGTKRHKDITVPSNVSGKIFIAITRGTDGDTTEIPVHVLGVPHNLNVHWACMDSTRYRWNAVPGATEYEVSLLGTKYMEVIDTVSTTFYKHYFAGGMNPTHWVAVRALGTNGLTGRRSWAIKKEGRFNCPDMAPLAGFTANKLFACLGEVVTFKDSSYQGAVDDYLWDFGADATPDVAIGPGPHHVTFANPGFKTIEQEVTSTLGYDNLVRTDYVKVVSEATPTATLVVTPQPACAGEEVTLTVNSTYSGQNPTYDWFLNGSSDSTSTTNIFQTENLADGDVLGVRMNSSFNCPTNDDPVAISNLVTAQINAPFVPTVGMTLTPAVSCPGDMLTLTAYANHPLAYNFEWFRNGTLLPNLSGAVQTTNVLVDGDEIHARIRINPNSCVTETLVESPPVEVTWATNCGTSKTFSAENPAWEVYPNPFQDGIQVRLEAPTSTATLRLFDLTGRLLASSTIQSEQRWEVGSDLPAGAYWLEVSQGATRQGFRILKLH